MRSVSINALANTYNNDNALSALPDRFWINFEMCQVKSELIHIIATHRVNEFAKNAKIANEVVKLARRSSGIQRGATAPIVKMKNTLRSVAEIYSFAFFADNVF